MEKQTSKWQLLLDLMSLESTTGDECRMTDFLENEILKPAYCQNGVLDLEVKGHNVIVIKGRPKVVILAHIDTVGYTVGYGQKLINIGQPQAKNGDQLVTKHPKKYSATIGKKNTYHGDDIPPGTPLSYFNLPVEKTQTITGAYLDNRAGMLVALEILRTMKDAAVAFTIGEETDAHGALSCVRHLARKHNLTTYLISDITYATKHVKIGGGAVISGRDEMLPDKKLFETARQVALDNGIRWQLEVEGEGLSDAVGVIRSGTFSKFLFIGAAIKGYHTPYEKIKKSDIDDTIALYIALINHLNKQEARP